MRALKLTWSLPFEVLVTRADTELMAWSCGLELRGKVRSDSMKSLVWPQGRKRLALIAEGRTLPLEAMSCPLSLKVLSLGGCFNQPIV